MHFAALTGLFRGSKGDPKTVFVAGATGQTGTRVVLDLLSAGFTVRAGVEELQSAESLTDLAAQYRVCRNQQCDFKHFEPACLGVPKTTE